MEKHKELVSLVEPLVSFITKLPENPTSHFAMIKLQEMTWWVEKAINDKKDEVKRPTAEDENVPSPAYFG